MSECVQSDPPAVPPRSRSKKARREARLAKFERDKIIVECLNRGVSIPEIAARVRVTDKRMRERVREILARRMPAPPAEFAAMQVSRLNEALLVAYSAMSGLNLKAVDRVVRIVRELDRYHGFAAAERRSLPDACRLEAPAQRPLALLTLPDDSAEMAPQTLGNINSAPGNRMALEASGSSEAAAGHSEACTLDLAASGQNRLPLASEPNDGPRMAPQRLENIESAPGNGIGPGASDPEDAAPCLREAFAPDLTESEQNPQALPSAPNDRPETAPQRLEVIESAPGNGAAPEASNPQGCGWGRGEAPFVSPAAASPINARQPNVRAVANGIVAC